jgi:hypothetical protein
MRHMAKLRAALMVVLIGLSAAGLVLGQDSDPCREAYLDSGLSVQQRKRAGLLRPSKTLLLVCAATR